MSRLATSWLVYRLTGSPVLLGLIGFAGQIPTFVLAPFAGVWVDRWNRQKVLVLTQILLAVQTVAMGILTLSGHIKLWQVVALSALQGAVNAFDMPGRQSFLVQMVEGREDLGNAIALNSSMVNAARLVGPSLAGMIISAVGEGYCFLIDGVSYLFVIASLLFMRVSAPAIQRSETRMVDQLKEGWDYVTGFAPIRTVLLLFAWVSLLAMPYSVLMPVYASKVLHGGPHTLGFLMGASGVGALISAVSLAVRKSVVGLYRMITIAAGLFGLGLLGFAASRTLWLSLVLMVIVGFGMMQQFAASNTVIQTIVSDDKRGRVMSYWTMAFIGTAPFGSLLAGGLTSVIGVPETVAVSGAACILGALWFWSQRRELRTIIRPIYEQMGILPTTAGGIHLPSSGSR